MFIAWDHQIIIRSVWSDLTSLLIHCTPNIVGASLRGRPIIDSHGNKLQNPQRWGAHGGTPLQIKTQVSRATKSYKHPAPLEQSSEPRMLLP